MSKRPRTKLALHRETLRRLPPDSLAGAAGGWYFPTIMCPRTMDTCAGCGPTLACPTIGCPTFMDCPSFDSCRGCV
jgi:hypothetical protein